MLLGEMIVDRLARGMPCEYQATLAGAHMRDRAPAARQHDGEPQVYFDASHDYRLAAVATRAVGETY
jgi:hypothetical protein